MREILFRGKAINRDKGSHRSNYKNGSWVYGLLTRKYNEDFKFPAEMSDGYVSGIEIDYVTIGQYTQTDRALKYAFLVILLSLCAVFVAEMCVKSEINILNYLLIGAALFELVYLSLCHAEIQ